MKRNDTHNIYLPSNVNVRCMAAMPNIFVDGFGMLMLINSRKNPYRVDLLHSVDHITCHRFRMNFSELFRFNTEIDISIDSAAYKLVYRVRSFAVSIDASCFNLFTNYAFTYSIICSIVLLLLNHNNDSLDWCNVFCKKWTGAWKRRKQKRNLLTLSTHYEHLHEYIEHRTSNRTANIHTRSQSRCNSICEATPMRVLWALCVCVCVWRLQSTIKLENDENENQRTFIVCTAPFLFAMSPQFPHRPTNIHAAHNISTIIR